MAKSKVIDLNLTPSLEVQEELFTLNIQVKQEVIDAIIDTEVKRILSQQAYCKDLYLRPLLI